MKFDFAILTESRYEDPPERNDYINNVLLEDGLLKSALEELGFSVCRVDWARKDIDWNEIGCAVFRTTWDYFHRFDEFKEWMKRLEKQTTLFNSPEILYWNIDKHYLLDLEEKGVRIPPTQIIKSGSDRSLEELVLKTGWDELILKPTISGAARHTYRFKKEETEALEKIFRELILNEDMMLQEFIPSVLDKGEASFMVFGGKFSHAILKRAKPGDFRVQDDFGGTVHEYRASDEEIRFAEEVMKACPELPVYGRVDVIWDGNGRAMVSELELIEPELWFRFDEKAAPLLAKSLKERYLR